MILAGTSLDAMAGTAPSERTAAKYAAYNLYSYLQSDHWFESALAKVPHPDDPYNREFFAAFSSTITADAFYQKAMPVLLRHIPPKDAQTLGAIARKQSVSPIDQQTALLSYELMDKQAGPELARVWSELMENFSRHRLELAAAEIKRGVADLAAHDDPDYVPTLNKLGLGYLDRMVSMNVNLFAKQMRGERIVARSCGDTDASLQPAVILADGGFAAARAVIDGCERAVQVRETADKSAWNEFEATVAEMTENLSNRPLALKQLEQAARAHSERNIQYGQLTRQILQDQRNLVSLIEARRKHFHLEDDQLAVDDDGDLAKLNQIAGDLEAHVKAANDFLNQARQNSALRDVSLK